MRIIIYIVFSLFVGMLEVFSQTTTTTQSSSSNTIVLVDQEIMHDSDNVVSSRNESSYFSTSDWNKTYKVRAKFSKHKTVKVRSYLLEELGEIGMVKTGNKLLWKKEYNGDTGYEVKLEEGKLRIIVNKEVTSSKLFNKFKTITKNIKKYTSGNSNEQGD